MNEEALREYFNDQSGVHQKFGTVDCVKFVAGAVRAGWNRDYLGVLQYSDRRSAVARLRELGGLRAACDMAMGEAVSVDSLEPGDVVWFDKPATIGLLMQEYVAVKLGKTIHRFKVDPKMIGWKT
ncbi:MAG: hypothetical protein E4G74_00325 [Erysipelotrichales bacterium]|nr:MAG: hypothetical protein E4G74_00325 [Erysipelotrichales bacterium]